MILARMVVEHRLRAEDPLSLPTSDWEEDATTALLDPGAVSLERAARACNCLVPEPVDDLLVDPDRVGGLKCVACAGNHVQLGLRDFALDEVRVFRQDQYVLGPRVRSAPGI